MLTRALLGSCLLLAACGGDNSIVTPPPPVLASVTVSLSSTTIEAGQTSTAGATGVDQNGLAVALGDVAWSSSSPSVATVNSSGVVVGVSPGETMVIATAGGVQGRQAIRVTPIGVASVVVSQTIATVAVAATAQHTATLRDARNNLLAGRAVTWSSSNPLVANVSQTGLVTGVSAGGPVVITAVSEGKSAVATVTVAAPRAVCTGGPATVAVLVDPRLGSSIAAGLDRFERDICDDGWAIVELRSEFASATELRSFLASYLNANNQRLDGLMLIGSFPRAYQFVVAKSTNPSFPETREELISYQYFADLDGVFAASPGYASAGGHPVSFDLHSGNIESELWVGVLPLYQGSYAVTEAALTRYFQKNHDYRTGVSSLPRRFLLVSEHFVAATAEEQAFYTTGLRTGTYAWTPFSNAADAQIFFNGLGTTVDQGYAALSAGTADFFVGQAHGFAGAHGKLPIAWAESQPIKSFFFWSDGCAVGNLDVTQNFLTSVLYSPTSSVVVAKGTTNNSGGMGTNSEGFYGHNVATSLSQGRPFGDALRRHINVPLLWPWSDSREFHIATSVVLGDPTLRLR